MVTGMTASLLKTSATARVQWLESMVEFTMDSGKTMAGKVKAQWLGKMDTSMKGSGKATGSMAQASLSGPTLATIRVKCAKANAMDTVR